MPRKLEYDRNPAKCRQYSKKYKEKYREKYRRDARARSQRNREILRLLKTQPCSDCGGYFPFYVMEFDHVENKKYNVSAMTSMSTGKMIEELCKCEVVCANCHRIRTWTRKNGKETDS